MAHSWLWARRWLGSPLPFTVETSAGLSGWLNGFTAAFAAASLGYLTPAESLCQVELAPSPVWRGQGAMTALLCRLRESPVPSEAQLLRYQVHRLVQTLPAQIGRIDEIETKLDVIDQQLKALEPASAPVKPPETVHP